MKSAKLGQGRCKERREREGRVDGPYCRSEKKSDGQARACCQGDNGIDL